MFLRGSSPHPHDLPEESAAARVPLLATAPRGAASTRPPAAARSIQRAKPRAISNLNANALPPMSCVSQSPSVTIASHNVCAVLMPNTMPTLPSQVARQRRQNGMAADADHAWVEAFFEQQDKDGDGGLDAAEVSHVLQALGLEADDEHVTSLFERFDADGSGEIGTDEFEPFVQFLCAFRGFVLALRPLPPLGRGAGRRLPAAPCNLNLTAPLVFLLPLAAATGAGSQCMTPLSRAVTSRRTWKAWPQGARWLPCTTRTSCGTTPPSTASIPRRSPPAAITS